MKSGDKKPALSEFYCFVINVMKIKTEYHHQSLYHQRV